jgi:hypothetical protein
MNGTGNVSGVDLKSSFPRSQKAKICFNYMEILKSQLTHSFGCQMQ